MARMNFDAKQFLLQHGERVGLYAAAGVMALLLLFGLKATAVGLGSHYAKDLNTKNDQVKRNITTSSPSDDQKAEIKKIDPKLNTKVAFEKIDADKYPAQAAWFRPVAPDENKRRNPHILQPVEFIAQVIYPQLRAYKLSPDKEKILVVEGAKTDATALKSFAGRFHGFGDVPGGMMGGMPGGGSGMPGGSGPGRGFPGGTGRFPPGAPGGGFPGGTGRFPPGGNGMMGGMMQGRGRGANFMNLKRDDDEVKTRMISIDRLPKETNVKPAEDILPVRMVEVVASFPYKQQLEEFRKALLMKNIYELFADPTSAPEFKGFDVERADVRPGQPENWAPVNLDQSFRPLQLLTGREYEADPPELEPVSFLGLVLPKLRQCREDQYPKIETDLKHLSDTLAKLKESQRGKVAKPANPFKDTEGVSIFDRGDATPAGGGPGGPGGAGMPNFPGGVSQPGLPGGARGGEGAFSAQEAIIPDYCLVRFFDPTVQPGHTYKYRIRIRMANPNYGKTKEVVGPSQAKEKELASDPVELPDAVVMPPEEYYYAVDMKALEPKERAFFNMPSATQAALTNQVPMQMQRWLDTVYDPKNSSVGFPVGDWVIADRALLTRGEYTGRTENVEVPIWDIRHDVFTLASFKRLGPRSRTSAKVPVPFGDETGAGDSILVDFQSGGQLTYDRFAGIDDNSGKPKYTTIKDPPTSVTKDTRVPMEVLLMSPDGKLILHDGVEDIKKYKDRYDQVKKRLDDVKNHKEPSNTKPGGPVLNPFGKS